MPITVKPIWGQDLKPGTHVYMRQDDTFLSDGIIWFTTLTESCDFAASHCIFVVNETVALESSLKGVEYCKYMDKYINNPHYECVCREPLGLDELAFNQAYERGRYMQYEQYGYDYIALFGGFPAVILTELTDLFPFMRKWPVPFHIPFARVCSALIADMEKHTDKYKDIQLFKDWHITRIDPVKLYNHFPYVPMRFEPH